MFRFIAALLLIGLAFGCVEPEPQAKTKIDIRVAGQDAVRSYIGTQQIDFNWEVDTRQIDDRTWITKGVYRLAGSENRYGAKFVLDGDQYALDNLLINGQEVYRRPE